MPERTQTLVMLVDSKNAEFVAQYQRGFRWAMHGKRESTGPLDDQYVIENLTAGVQQGWFEEQQRTALERHMGFLLGMLHGAVISPETNTVLPHTATLVMLHDTEFQRGYQAGREYYFLEADPDEWRKTDRSVIHFVQDALIDMSKIRHSQAVWHFCLGCLIGELSGQIFPCTPQEIQGWEQEHLELCGYEQHIVIVDRPFLYQVQQA